MMGRNGFVSPVESAPGGGGGGVSTMTSRAGWRGLSMDASCVGKVGKVPR